MKLQKMADFVLENTSQKFEDYTNERLLLKIRRYAQFLKKTITLGMLVPVDEAGNVLEPCGCISDYGCCKQEYEYQQAKEKVLFVNAVTIDESPHRMTKRFMVNLNHPAGFRIYNKFTFHDGRTETEFLPNFSKTPTIEYLVDYELELTPSALKQIGL